MSRVVVLVNPASGAGRDRAGSGWPDGIEVVRTRDAIDAARQVDGLGRRDLLVVDGGDGTVQQLLTVLGSRRPNRRLPVLAVLPGGSTNMTAGSFNVRRRYGAARQRLLELVAAGRATLPARPVWPVRVDRLARDGARTVGTPVRGFFFGAGEIVCGIRDAHATVYRHAGRHELGAGIALLRQLRSAGLPTGMRLSDPVDGRPLRAALATTLNRLFLGLTPWWDVPTAAHARVLRVTTVDRDARWFGAHLPRFLTGRPGGGVDAAHGFRSGAAVQVAFDLADAFTLDGELFDCNGQVVARLDAPLQVLSL